MRTQTRAHTHRLIIHTDLVKNSYVRSSLLQKNIFWIIPEKPFRPYANKRITFLD